MKLQSFIKSKENINHIEVFNEQGRRIRVFEVPGALTEAARRAGNINREEGADGKITAVFRKGRMNI